MISSSTIATISSMTSAGTAEDRQARVIPIKTGFKFMVLFYLNRRFRHVPKRQP